MTVRFAKALEPFLVPIDSVKPHPDNPNEGNDAVVIESIRENGFVSLPTADKNTGYMVAGHTRLRALKKLGATHIPILWEDQWDETGAKRYLIGDNASAAKAVMNNAKLAELLGEIAETQQGLVGTAITQDEYAALLAEIATSHEDPDIAGFGHGDQGALGLFQIVIDFPDDRDERDAVFAELSLRFPENIRVANL
jgi:hypothetical protein